MDNLLLEYSDRYPSLLIDLQGVSDKLPQELLTCLDLLEDSARQHGHMLKIDDIQDNVGYWTFHYKIFVLQGGDEHWTGYDEIIQKGARTLPR
jgi:hypothetical protein